VVLGEDGREKKRKGKSKRIRLRKENKQIEKG
jgi:hypothetical protein